MSTLGLLALVAPLSAPAPDLDLTWTGGNLGTGLVYQLDGDAFELCVLLPSLTAGPTPLSLFIFGETRVLDVGLDLAASAITLPLNGAGQAILPVPISASPPLSGVSLRAQAFSINFGPGSPVDDLSSAVQSTLLLPGALAGFGSVPVVARRGHTLARIPDGRVLLIGGEVTDGSGNAQSTNTWESFDPQAEVFTAGPSTLGTSRSRHQATPLLDGRVLVSGGAQSVGGTGAGATVLSSAELFDPVTFAFGPTGSMLAARVQHTATRLLDGRVFVAGGRSSAVDLRHSLGGTGANATLPTGTELFDPVTGSWSPGPSIPVGRFGHTATLLGDGRVLLAGGEVFDPPAQTVTVAPTASVLIFDPVSGSISPGASLPIATAYHGAVESGTGGVFLVGGATSLTFIPGVAPGGEDLAIYTSTGATPLFYSLGPGVWTSEGPFFPVAIVPRVHCVPTSGGCYEYVLIECEGADVVASGGSSSDGWITMEKCGASAMLVISDLPNDNGTGHNTVLMDEYNRILATMTIDGTGPPSASSVVFGGG